MIRKAAEFAARAHEGALRKGSKIPYISHPMEVAMIVALMTEDQDLIAAAYLHDVIEDAGVTYEKLEQEFGPHIAELVRRESEDKSKSWMERKQATIDRLITAGREDRILAFGDKLSNLRSTAKDYMVIGDEIWQKFRAKDKNLQGWYYKSMVDSFAVFKDHPFYQEYLWLLDMVFEWKPALALQARPKYAKNEMHLIKKGLERTFMMNISYQSTRGGEKDITASQAILKGLACDGGLFMPVEIPKFNLTMRDLAGKTYQETAYEVMKLFLTDFTEEELKSCINQAYDDKFDTEVIVPLVKADGAYYLELFHGSTIAFKDMALSILPHLMTTAAKKNHVDQEIVILTATSGDTGKAAMAGFADVPGTRIIVFYPKGGVSKVQKLQMVTQKGDNTAVVAIHGNFDDAQTGVKKIFADKEFEKELAEKGFVLSSANSINIGRLVPQIVYYVYAYAQLLNNGEISDGEKIHVTVPTGNFGNILAAYFAKQMGVPIDRLICASNDNKVLYDFFRTGTYDKKRDFMLTISPSMDILISSNLERLIYLSTGCNTEKTAGLMKDLAEKGVYSVSEDMKQRMSDFMGGFATEQEDKDAIRQVYSDTGYVLDTHTGVACAVYRKYQADSKDATKTVIASTASPYKFSRSVMEAIKEDVLPEDEFAVIDDLHHISGTKIPQAVEEIRTAPIRHTKECDIADMKSMVAGILGL